MDDLARLGLADPSLSAILLAAFLFGESVVLAAPVLGARGLVAVPVVLLLALAGSLASDLAWFLGGQRALAILRRWPSFERRCGAWFDRMRDRDPGRRFRYLLFFKFVYGARVLTIVYSSLQGISLGRFVWLDGLGTCLMMALLLAGAALFWEGAARVLPIDTLGGAGLALLVLLVGVRLGIRWLGKRSHAR